MVFYQHYLNVYLNELDSAVKKINTHLQFISDISKAYNLVLNETKTDMLIFGSNRMAIIENIDFKIVINNQTLATSTCSKNLGLYLDADLRFSEHVNNVIKKSYGKLKMLYIHKDILSTDLKLRLSDTLILSGLAYCHIVYWPALLSSDKSSLQKIQNSCWLVGCWSRIVCPKKTKGS